MDDAELINYPQNTNDQLEAVFRHEDHSSSVQQLGAVEMRVGRLITFQHSLAPGPAFLAGRSLETWHQKRLALFLVDPTVKVISTAHVPCQRKDWWQEIVNMRSAIGDFPHELQDQVFHMLHTR
jgi:hypothetical protein